MIKTINKVAKDNAVKAVVFRVSSPGGSAYGSEQIWRALANLKEKKPLIVSMGDYAASGGYYISSIADQIVAQPNTITGSIGIFGMIPNVDGLYKKIGLTFDGVKTNKMSDMPRITSYNVCYTKLLREVCMVRLSKPGRRAALESNASGSGKVSP